MQAREERRKGIAGELDALSRRSAQAMIDKERTDPKGLAVELAQYATIQKVLDGANLPAKIRLRIAGRLIIEKKGERLERDLITAHDPMIWINRAKTRIVTEQTMNGIVSAVNWYDGLQHYPPENPSFADGARVVLRKGMDGLPDQQQYAISMVEATLPAARLWATKMPKAKLDNYLKRVGASAHPPSVMPDLTSFVSFKIAADANQARGVTGQMADVVLRSEMINEQAFFYGPMMENMIHANAASVGP